MKWACLGLNYRTAPVEVREKFAVPAHRISEEGEKMRACPGVKGCVILSTCNRMELYFTLDKSASLTGLEEWLLGSRAVSVEPGKYFYTREGGEVSYHLCRVLSGLDSMVLGETEIFGQVKKAYSMALAAKLTDGHLNKLFQKAFSVGKKVRTHTSINEGTISIGSTAVELAEQIFGDLQKTKVLILGAGEMSRVTAQSLQSRGASGIFVANRSFGRAVELAKTMNGEAIRFDEWTEHLKTVDIVIASTAAPHYIVEPKDVEPIRAARKYRSLFLIDISVPRNVSPEVADIDEVYLYDIDTLRELADASRKKRAQEIAHCEEIIKTEMKDMDIQVQVPSLILGTRGSALALAQAEMTEKALSAKYPSMNPRREIIKTTGDIRTDVPLAQVAQASGIVDKGVFIKELETALYNGDVDVAVHSLKDMPSELDARFRLAAILPRASCADVIISKRGTGDDAIPQGGIVATSSVRRRRQLLMLRPDVTVSDVRGNVPTRLDKLAEHEDWDALLLAKAGLDRLGLTPEILAARDVPLYVTECDPDEFLPAAGQGAVALEIRADNTRVAALLAPLNDLETEISIRAEREFLRLLGAGCSTPIGVRTRLQGDKLTLCARLFSEDETETAPLEIEVSGEANDPEAIAALALEAVKKA